MAGRKHSAATRARLSAANKRYWSDPANVRANAEARMRNGTQICTADLQLLLAALKDGTPVAAVAAQFLLTRSSVYRLARAHGVAYGRKAVAASSKRAP